MPPTLALFDEVCRYVCQSSLLTSVSAVLEWDERTMMPAAEAEHRADQTALLSGLIHQRWTDEGFVAKVSELAASPLATSTQYEGDDSGTAATIRRLKRLVDKKTKLPRRLVEELTR